jgi:prepilin-type N-terminal cleavage/methylation domain-containing protein
MMMISRLRNRMVRHGDDGDAGFTLVEQIVAVAVMGIVLVMVLGFLMQATEITARSDSNTRAEQNAILAMRTITEDIRSAKTLSQCTGLTWDKCITVEILKSTVSGQTCPKRIATYQVVSGELKQAYTDYAANCTTVTKTVNRPLISGVQNTSLFTYYGTDGVTALNLADTTEAAKVIFSPAVKTSLTVLHRKNVKTLSLSSFASRRNKQ